MEGYISSKTHLEWLHDLADSYRGAKIMISQNHTEGYMISQIHFEELNDLPD